MKVSKEKAAEHRAAIVKAAAALFRSRGFEGASVAEIMKAAGLTHGGFYGHFVSKDALAAEACGRAFAESLDRLSVTAAGEGGLRTYLDSYLSERHRDRHRDGGCPMAACCSEVGRQDPVVQESFTEGVARFVEAISGELPESEDMATRRRRAIAILSAMVGGMALARATAVSAPELSEDILASLRLELGRLASP